MLNTQNPAIFRFMLREQLLMATNCLSASIAQDKDPARTRTGKKNKITRFMTRAISPVLRKFVHDQVFRDTLPSHRHDETPLSFGGGSIVWKVYDSNSNPGVLKIDRIDKSKKQDLLQVTSRVEVHNYLSSRFGNLVVPTSFLKLRQPYAGGPPVVGRYQKYIDYKKDLFEMSPEELTSLNPADRSMLRTGMNSLFEDGVLPDILGPSNIVVTDEGAIKIIDGEDLIVQSKDPVWWGQAVEKLDELYDRLEQSDLLQAQSFANSA